MSSYFELLFVVEMLRALTREMKNRNVTIDRHTKLSLSYDLNTWCRATETFVPRVVRFMHLCNKIIYNSAAVSREAFNIIYELVERCTWCVHFKFNKTKWNIKYNMFILK